MFVLPSQVALLHHGKAVHQSHPGGLVTNRLDHHLVSQVQHNIRTYSEVSRALSHLNESRQANPRLERICLKSPAPVKTPSTSVRKTVHLHTVVDGKGTFKPGYYCMFF